MIKLEFNRGESVSGIVPESSAHPIRALLQRVASLQSEVNDIRTTVAGIDRKIGQIQQTQERVAEAATVAAAASIAAVVLSPQGLSTISNALQRIIEAPAAWQKLQIDNLLALHPHWTEADALLYLEQQATLQAMQGQIDHILEQVGPSVYN